MSDPWVKGDFGSKIRRCEHEVYKPDDVWENQPNPCCSICQSKKEK